MSFSWISRQSLAGEWQTEVKCQVSSFVQWQKCRIIKDWIVCLSWISWLIGLYVAFIYLLNEINEWNAYLGWPEVIGVWLPDECISFGGAVFIIGEVGISDGYACFETPECAEQPLVSIGHSAAYQITLVTVVLDCGERGGSAEIVLGEVGLHSEKNFRWRFHWATNDIRAGPEYP